jgi:hypothetical protein
MNARLLLRLATLVAASASLLILYILIPERGWSNVTIISALLLASSFAFILYVPYASRRHGSHNDAVTLASIGPLGIAAIAQIVWALLTLVVTLVASPKYSWVMIVIGVSGMLISIFVTQAAAKIIDTNGQERHRPSSVRYWVLELEEFREKVEIQNKGLIDQLIEKINYSASEFSTHTKAVDIDIELKIRQMQSTTPSDSALPDRIDSLSKLLDRRNSVLRIARSKN